VIQFHTTETAAVKISAAGDKILAVPELQLHPVGRLHFGKPKGSGKMELPKGNQTFYSQNSQVNSATG